MLIMLHLPRLVYLHNVYTSSKNASVRATARERQLSLKVFVLGRTLSSKSQKTYVK